MSGSRTALADLLWSEIAAAGHTQAEAAATVGISQQQISRGINGHDGMSLDLVDQILAACGRELVLSTRVIPEREGSQPLAHQPRPHAAAPATCIASPAQPSQRPNPMP